MFYEERSNDFHADLIEIYFDGRTGFTRLCNGALVCIDDDSGVVDTVAPPMNYSLFIWYFCDVEFQISFFLLGSVFLLRIILFVICEYWKLLIRASSISAIHNKNDMNSIIVFPMCITFE